ncbi:unnamed protein product, partial [Polarella glacialis]
VGFVAATAQESFSPLSSSQPVRFQLCEGARLPSLVVCRACPAALHGVRHRSAGPGPVDAGTALEAIGREESSGHLPLLTGRW